MDANNRQDQTRYIIPAIEPEKRRLVRQYDFAKSVYGWHQAVPSIIDIARIHDVLDIAAGTCIWIFDLTSLPLVKMRLVEREHIVEPIHLHACDIDTKFFPPQAILDELRIDTFQQDVTKPFPEHLYGKFDLLHMSFLLLCLTQAEWKEALKNCFQLLKPGGTLMIVETDAVLFTDSSSPPANASGYELSRCMNGDSWVHKANRIFTAWALRSEFVIDLSSSLKTMLKEAGFDIEDSRRVVGPHGRTCRNYAVPGGDDLSEFEDFSAENMSFVLGHLSKALMQNQALETPQGSVITTEDERKALMQEVEEGFRREGAFSYSGYCIGKKPHGSPAT